MSLILLPFLCYDAKMCHLRLGNLANLLRVVNKKEGEAFNGTTGPTTLFIDAIFKGRNPFRTLKVDIAKSVFEG